MKISKRRIYRLLTTEGFTKLTTTKSTTYKSRLTRMIFDPSLESTHLLLLHKQRAGKPGRRRMAREKEQEQRSFRILRPI